MMIVTLICISACFQDLVLWCGLIVYLNAEKGYFIEVKKKMGVCLF